MSILDQLTQQAGRIAEDVQQSVKRARVQGERRLLERQHRAALEELGAATYALITRGEMDSGPLAARVAAVHSAQMEIDGKDAEIAALAETPPRAASTPSEPPTGGPGPGWEAAQRFFPR